MLSQYEPNHHDRLPDASVYYRSQHFEQSRIYKASKTKGRLCDPLFNQEESKYRAFIQR
jgi:hypothetical protein